MAFSLTSASRLGTVTRTWWLVFAGLLFLWLAGDPLTVAAQEVPELKINSEHYIVIDADTGEVFAQRGADDQVAMASLTKVFTLIEAIEAAPLDTPIMTMESDLRNPETNSLMGFGPGETFTLEDLIYGLMLPSGNDAALAIARHLGYEEGDTAEKAVDRFVTRINQRVAYMGLANTHLVNPHGWGVPNHYTSAHDLAVFTMYALQYPAAVDAMSAATYTTTDGRYVLHNNNGLMYSYEDILGGKTGFDFDSGWCLIEVASRDGHTMISVTLDGVHEGGDWYDDNRVLLEYAFAEKEARLAADTPITGDILSYRLPDIAMIAENAQPGAAIGSTSPLSADQPDDDGRAAAALPQPAAEAPGVSPSTDYQLLAVIGVAAIVVAAGVTRPLLWPNRG